MRLFLTLLFIFILCGFEAAPSNAQEPEEQTQPEQELEQLRTLFRDIVSQTEARIEEQAASLAAAEDKAARLAEQLATAQQEVERLSAALSDAEAARTEAAAARAEAEAARTEAEAARA